VLRRARNVLSEKEQRMKTTFVKTLVLPLLSVGLMSSCGNPGDAEPEELVRSNSKIVGGFTMTADQVNTWGLMGIYHPGDVAGTWFPRPCSAEVLRSSGGTSWVLTARHCVTSNHQINGTVVANSQLKLISGTNLPILSGTQTPPSAAVSPNLIVAESATSSTDYAHDLALVRVSANWSTLVGYRRALYVGAPSALNGREFNAFGYGVSDPTVMCSVAPYPSNTAGVARYGGLFNVGSTTGNSTGGTYTYLNRSSFSQYTNCGDSGGPDIAPFGTDDSPYDQIIGVHSTGANPDVFVNSALVTRWVQDQLGGIYLINDNVAGVGQVSGNVLGFVPVGSSLATAFKYDSATQQIIAGSQCLGLTSGLPRAQACDTNNATQRWNVLWNRWITNTTNNQCLKALSSTNVVVQTCVSSIQAAQYWTFITQN
jgi:hypothetical protein